MRLVTPRKNSLGLVTTKGWSGTNSHHPQWSEKPVNFVGVDGEGISLPDGSHSYALFGVGNVQIQNSMGLQWDEVFDFLYGLYRPRTAFVGFYLGYDFTQIFKTLPEDRARMLLTAEGRLLRKHRIAGKPPHPVEANGWHFDVLGMKRMRIRPKACGCSVVTCKCTHPPWQYVCDVGHFFQTSFLTAIDPSKWPSGREIVTRDEYELIRIGKENRSEAIAVDDDMRMYNQLENDVLCRMMRVVDEGFHAIGVHLTSSKWFGPGQAAQTWLKKIQVPTGEQIREVVPDAFLEASRCAYFGGWFEISVHGIVPGISHEYDVNSAYPAIIANLPCLLHGRYSIGEGIPDTHPGDLCAVYARILAPGMPGAAITQRLGTMLHRDPHGRILRPLATQGWFWWDELQAANRARLVKRLDKHRKQRILHWVKYEPCNCDPPMAAISDLYLRRLEVGKNTPMGKGARLVYNSDYGKFAQSVGDPIYGNPVYASRITSGCRTQILEAVGTHPDGMSAVCMVATDGVYFMSPHPSLPISSKLGEWDHAEKANLTLFKPGVYWDDATRERIANGKSAAFKARGFKASDFIRQIESVDDTFIAWNRIG